MGNELRASPATKSATKLLPRFAEVDPANGVGAIDPPKRTVAVARDDDLAV